MSAKKRPGSGKTVKPLALTLLGDPVLRGRAKKVPESSLSLVAELAPRLVVTMIDAEGVGIAAPQVGVPWRVFVVASRPNPRYPKAPAMHPVVMVNPVVEKRYGGLVDGWEGCLSVPGLRGIVPRHRKLRVSFTNLDGTRSRAVLTDFVARIFQHEFDHIDGRLYIDRVQRSRDFMTDVEFSKRILGK